MGGTANMLKKAKEGGPMHTRGWNRPTTSEMKEKAGYCK